MNLINAPAPGPLVTATALLLASIVLYAVLFTLAFLHARRCDKAEEAGYRKAYAEQELLVDDLRDEINHLEQRNADLSKQMGAAA
jgi:hypothetical protein